MVSECPRKRRLKGQIGKRYDDATLLTYKAVARASVVSKSKRGNARKVLAALSTTMIEALITRTLRTTGRDTISSRAAI